MYSYLDKLNDKQREAVLETEGPVLVIAGAGSGKTTVLVNRIAYILQTTYAKPWNILAITFTNKAANEMKTRIENIIGINSREMWVGTFHSICVKILRKHIERIGYGRDFVIYDSADSRTLMKECVKELNLDDKQYPARAVLSAISNAKNEMMSADEYYNMNCRDFRLRHYADAYELYQSKLKRNNALDFDDIIYHTVNILKDNPDVAEEYQKRFQYILVDEYQDTNEAQYSLINILAKGYGNICVVGDDDQSIYKFRGANINNILNFERDYKNTTKIMLEQNYRSTSNILDAANSVIDNNTKRMGKNLWTSQNEGEKITLFTASDEREEASFIAEEIGKLHNAGKNYSDFAILYRTNAQSRALEEKLMREAIPYRVLAGLRFYDRKEIKDIIAYLRVVYNPHDDMGLRRIINEPKRKIGAATLEKLSTLSTQYGISNFEIIDNVDMYPDLKSAAPRLKMFAAFIKKMRKLATELNIYELTKKIAVDSGYMAMLENENTVEAKTRLENIGELFGVVSEYASSVETSGELGEFLENVTLVSDIDNYDAEQDSVVLMTIHSAKGLEFPVVFLSGMEEGLFPGMQAVSDKEELEEERRLCYVAITRAKEKLYVTGASSRFHFGKRMPCMRSRFANEIPKEYAQDVSDIGVKVKHSLADMGIRVKKDTSKMPSYKPYVPPADPGRFRQGDRVRHRKFGDGTVLSAQQFGKDSILVIDFDTAGQKRLMAAFAKLEKIY